MKLTFFSNVASPTETATGDIFSNAYDKRTKSNAAHYRLDLLVISLSALIVAGTVLTAVASVIAG